MGRSEDERLESLLRGVMTLENKAWEAFVTDFGRAVKAALIYEFPGMRNEMDDITQEIWMKFIQRIQTTGLKRLDFSNKNAIFKYLLTMGRNTIWDHLRKSNPEESIVLVFLTPEEIEKIKSLDELEETLNRLPQETINWFYRGIDDFLAEYKEKNHESARICQARWIEGMTESAIVDRYKKTKGSVRQALYRGRRDLRGYLEQRRPFPVGKEKGEGQPDLDERP